MVEHTPGPWTLEDWSEDDGPNKTTLTGRVPCRADWERRLWDGDTRQVRIADLREAENRDGNGPLLCAAPDMLVALKAAKSWMEEYTDPCGEPYNTICAAIEKAST